MAKNISTYNSDSGNDDKVDDMVVFTTVASAMSQLPADGRLRLLRTLATFFELPLNLPALDTSIESPRPTSTGLAPSSAGANTTVAPGFFSEDRSASPKQFLFIKRPQTDIERIACLAYYLTHYRDTQHFKTLDLSKLNTEAAQVKLSNPTVAVDNAAQAGFLAQSGQGRKQISALGELYVQALPDRIAAKEAVAAYRLKRYKTKAKPPASKK